ncbi:MAG TPA: leucyl/phenylalanyl-tRNA--protein transferase [Saprospiraceae bacterium]|nr:leucyl/phenylalanyl-tRNA--protein transferase [Saprospiraceae bacterium]
MPVFSLDDKLIFPHPVLRDPDGLLAWGGDLSIDRLLLAYRWGIFPWYHEGQPLLWWFLAPRLMLKPEEIHISHSLRSILKKEIFQVTFNTAFAEVMKNCGEIKRLNQDGTWITKDILKSYFELHKAGYAHSVEVWQENELVGGLYGVGYGRIFTGESMFAKKSNASKIAFVYLARHLSAKQFEWIDCQQDTPHLRSMGADLIQEDQFMEILRDNHLFILKTRNSKTDFPSPQPQPNLY